ncbi:YHS domain-containing (seleno)protein [Roseomonas fluvialis]|nr:YHS domain-containing (seleno)protein [Roseomonas fluvialis]
MRARGSVSGTTPARARGTVGSLARRRLCQGAVALMCGRPDRLRAQAMPLAIRGYDTVAYFTLARPTPGLPAHAFDWDEHRYQFATAAHLDLFRAEPARYAPYFANYCAMALTRGEIDEPNPEYWLVSDGRLYLFGKPIGPALFQAALTDNVERAERHRASLRLR